MGECLIKRAGSAIDISELTATPDDVAENSTFIGSGTDDEQTGRVKNNGVISRALGINETYTVPAGIIEAGSRAYQQIPTSGAVSVTPSVEGKVAGVAGKYLTGDVTILGIENLYPENIKSGVFVGSVAGTWRGYVNTDPLCPYWYGIFAPGQSASAVVNRDYNSSGTFTPGTVYVDYHSGPADPYGEMILLIASISSSREHLDYPAIRFNTAIEMQGVKSITIRYALRSDSANQYTRLVVAENSVRHISEGAVWGLSPELGNCEEFTLPATKESGSSIDDRLEERTFYFTKDASNYHYIYVGIGVQPTVADSRSIAVQAIKLNK